jgi:putative transposase
MTDVTNGENQDAAGLSAADEQLLKELTERARAGGLKLTGEGGLLGKLTKMVVEGALEGEMDDHLGYEKHDPAGRSGGNSRNGYRAKTVLTEAGPVEISVPRDRDSSRVRQVPFLLFSPCMPMNASATSPTSSVSFSSRTSAGTSP